MNLSFLAQQDVEAYVMDAAAIDVPFLLSKLNEPMSGTATSAQHRGSTAALVPRAPLAFDAVFSNAALHWIRTPRAVINGVKRVLRPGGRFVGEFGGHGNIATPRLAMHSVLLRRGVDPLEMDPWYFPTAEEYRSLLEEVRHGRENTGEQQESPFK